MRTVTYRLVDLLHATINLGFRGENEHTRIIFDAKKVFEDYPNAIPSLAVTPPKGDSYPAVCVRDGNLVYGDVLDSDVAYDGSGEGQLTFTVNNVVAKNYVFKTKISRSILPTGEAPSAINDWILRANAALGAIPQAIADALEEAKASGEFDGEDGVGIDRITLNADYTLTIYLTDGSSYTTESIRGAKGDDGSAFVVHAASDSGGSFILDKTWQEISDASRTTPVILTEESGDAAVFYCDELYAESHTYYATFKSAHELLIFSVNDPSGYPALEPDRIAFPTIDDEAGEGATDVTFSADKLTSEFDALSNALNQSNAATSSDIGKAHSPKTVENGQVTEWQYVEVGGGGGGDLPEDFPTDETAQELLEYETYNAGLTDTALAVIGMLFTNLPQDETATDILHSLELECERLDLIYNGWIAEREGA